MLVFHCCLGFSLDAMFGLLIVVASLVEEHRFQGTQASVVTAHGSIVVAPGLQVQQLLCRSLAVLQLVGSSWIKDQTLVYCIGRRIIYPRATRETLDSISISHLKNSRNDRPKLVQMPNPLSVKYDQEDNKKQQLETNVWSWENKRGLIARKRVLDRQNTSAHTKRPGESRYQCVPYQERTGQKFPSLRFAHCIVRTRVLSLSPNSCKNCLICV